MKVGIITIHNSPSYGACLQTFALWKYISGIGVDCEVIDLRRPTHSDYRKSKHFRPMRVQAVSWKGQMTSRIQRIINKIRKNRSQSVKKQRFEHFNQQIHFSRRYRGLDELYVNPPQFDVYITGSDQVWNPMQPYCMEPYFLTFVNNPDSMKISYASSIGLDDLRPTEKEKFASWLESYDAIGVREVAAQKLIASFSSKPTTRVLDPTFLLKREYWEGMAIVPQIKRSYILLFSLSYHPRLIRFAHEMSKQINSALVIIAPISDLLEEDCIVVNDAGPKEFLGFIQDAVMTITDSFHGTVFSMLMGRGNFYSYIGKNNKKGSRIIDLLNLFHLENHLLSPSLQDDISSLLENKLDREALNDSIEIERNKSMDFLAHYIHE